MEARIAQLENLFSTIHSSIQQLSTQIQNLRSPPKTHQDSLQLIHYTPQDTPTIRRVRQECHKLGLYSARFKQVPQDYYSRSLEERRKLLDATTIDHLCKSIIMENVYCKQPNGKTNSKYYCCIVQYTQKLNADALMKFIRDLNEGKNFGKSAFNFRVAEKEIGEELTGFKKQAISPVGMKTPIPIVLSKNILSLRPRYIWLGAGEVDWKVEFSVDEFIQVLQPLIADISEPRSL
jgi:prolyl-tRNA editing enzyme YbaK/EbsC (Cys-tRNA(Pro) deacylase)